MLIKSMSKFESLPRKEREKLFKKHEIISAAIKLFAAKGYEKTTLDEIAAASEFGKGTIYNYFSNKEEIFIAIMESVTSDYLELLEENFNKTDTLRTLVEKITMNIFEYYLEKTEEFILMHRIRNLSVAFNPLEKSETLKNNLEKIRELYRKRISDAKKKKEIKDVDIDSLQLLMQSMFFGYLHQLNLCRKSEDVDVKKEVNFIVDILFTGIENK